MGLTAADSGDVEILGRHWESHADDLRQRLVASVQHRGETLEALGLRDQVDAAARRGEPIPPDVAFPTVADGALGVRFIAA